MLILKSAVLGRGLICDICGVYFARQSSRPFASYFYDLRKKTVVDDIRNPPFFFFTKVGVGQESNGGGGGGVEGKREVLRGKEVFNVPPRSY